MTQLTDRRYGLFSPELLQACRPAAPVERAGEDQRRVPSSAEGQIRSAYFTVCPLIKDSSNGGSSQLIDAGDKSAWMSGTIPPCRIAM